ncbi:MAG: putative oxidoreductase C-terminal domain-containing protein [Chitinophagaceae bacterium]|nr:putative oxidoreductase C-terminal domain-containing protein [Chitinophagaceae bacterium]
MIYSKPNSAALHRFIMVITGILFLSACSNNKMTTTKPVQLITLDPGHFHAALVQKTMYADVDSAVYVYAPEGNDLKLHLGRINSYNARTESPTRWKEEIYTGNDFFEKMIGAKKGNVVVLSGNNQKKTDYILQSLQNGLNVFADKPMVIDAAGFEKLKQAFEVAAKNKLLLYDIMTERYEINTILQRELSMIPEIFGKLQKGTSDNPAITKESIHHFYKYVSGSVLTRPAWFMDVSQQGEGIVDVMTHLVDLVQWECFPEQVIDYTKDITINTTKRWATGMSLQEFKAITKQDSFPAYLHNSLTNDTSIGVYCNGEINYTIKGIHAKTSVIWNYKAPEGTGDTHYSIMRGTKANLVIRQGKEESYKPVLYIEPVTDDTAFQTNLKQHFNIISTKFPGVELYKIGKGWSVKLPERLVEGHEAHFARVTEKFLEYLKNGNMPAWEMPNMLSKYYTTTKALEMALKNKQ